MCLWVWVCVARLLACYFVRSLTLKTHKKQVWREIVHTHTVTVKERRTFIVDCQENDRVYEFIKLSIYTAAFEELNNKQKEKKWNEMK